MADIQDTPTTGLDEEEVTNPVETPTGEDEQEDTSNPTGDDVETGKENEDAEDSEDVEDEPNDEDQPEFKRRFTQYKGETLEEYVKNLEKAHASSTTEAQRIAKEMKTLRADSENYNKVLELVANNPDVAAAIEKAGGEVKGEPKVDPAIEYAREQMNKQLQKEWDDFADLHPDIVEDKDLQKELLDELEAVDQIFAARGRKLTMTKGLEIAWRNLGNDDDKDKVMDKAKEQASKPNTQGNGKPKSDKPQFTDEQLAVAKKMGVSPEQLAEYSK